MLAQEILAQAQETGIDGFAQQLFKGFYLEEEPKHALLASLLTGHHILIVGPPGCGKTALAHRLAQALGPATVVAGCPVNCPIDSPHCPWCADAQRRGKAPQPLQLAGPQRVKKVQGSADLVPEDLIGELDPEVAFTQGLHSPAAFVPGKLLRANRGILLIDFIDRIPERVLNVLLHALEGGHISIGAYEEKIPLDILVVATGSPAGLHTMPRDMLDHFDIISLDYVADAAAEQGIVLSVLPTAISSPLVAQAVDIGRRTRSHSDVQRGVSTRGLIRYAELLAAYQARLEQTETLGQALRTEYRSPLRSESPPSGQGGQDALRPAAQVTLPHRLELPVEVDGAGKREQIINEIVDEVLGLRRGEKALAALSKADLSALVEEIARNDNIRKPLKYGAFDVLLRRLQRLPQSRLALLHREALRRLEELYPERFHGDNVTEELLLDIETSRKRAERLSKLKKEMEAEALAQTLSLLEQQKILQRGKAGFELSRRGINFLLERLTPRVWASIYSYGYGKHATGKKLTAGEGRQVGLRQYRFGDRYRDISFKDTIRQTLRHRRSTVTKEDIMVAIKDIRAKLDILLVADLSGTMRQLEKLWYAKESAIALSLAAAHSGDRVGVVSFSNLADVVVDITSSPYRVTQRVIDLELHENAFTNIGYGLLKAAQVFARHRGGRASQHIILISDGDATAPHPSPQKYALRQAARAAVQGITISCVCINEESTDPELMQRIARIGRGRIYFVGAEGISRAVIQERLAAGR